MEKRPIRLKNCPKHYTYDQDKVCSPEETVNNFVTRLKTVNLDILKEVRRIDNGRLDIPVFFSVTGKDARETIGNKKQMGKGSTPEQSRASACMELAERFSFFSFKKNPANFIVDTYANLLNSGYEILPLERLLKSVHDEKTSLELFAEIIADIPMQWTWATSLNREEEILIPFTWFFAINEFNGPSAGNTYEEAVSQGICEIIERHVCSIISRQQIKAPIIDLSNLQDQVSRELLAKFTRHKIEVYLNDFSLDTGIPTIGALAIDRSTFPHSSEIVFTAGTTPNPAKALIRALTEVAQLAGDFNTGSNYVASGLPKPLSMKEVEYLTNPGSTVSINDLPDLNDDDIKVEIDNCLAALAKIDLEVFIVNTMHPELQVPTIYTIVPGAHFRERSMVCDAGLFAAKIITEQTADPEQRSTRLAALQRLLPDAYYLEFYQGRNLFDLGHPSEALPHLEKALELNPDQEDIPYIYSYLGNCLKEMEQYDQAITMLKKGTEFDDERPDLHNLLGFCHFKLGDFHTAINHFNRTVELNPASAIDYANLGVNHRRLGNHDAAIKFFQLGLALDPTISFAQQQLAELQQEEAR